jgi:hypothetical protein
MPKLKTSSKAKLLNELFRVITALVEPEVISRKVNRARRRFSRGTMTGLQNLLCAQTESTGSNWRNYPVTEKHGPPC